jgi:cation:H+ antiporter
MFGGWSLTTLATVGLSGVAVVGASFLLAWAAETAEKDVPTAFAIAVLAVLAVAPEYAVDALYAWNAGAFAGTERGAEAANLAIANMTGANRILIGLGWSGIAMFTVYRAMHTGDPAVRNRPGWLANSVRLDRDIGLEIVFLFLATAWAFLVPFNGGIDVLDTVVLVGLYAAYIVIILRGEVEPPEEHGGVPQYFQGWSRPWRPLVVLVLFAFSGGLIFTAVEPFAHGLEELGLEYGIPAFFMIQWIAPLASETPELIVVAVLVNKARSTAGFNALISSKLNQWTLLIGTLAVVYSIALGQYGVLEFDAKQAAEIWITAAQSYFALAILVNFTISIREALALLVLFVSQVVIEFLAIRDILVLPITSHDLLLVYTAVYMVVGTVLFATRWQALQHLVQRTIRDVRIAIGGDEVTHPGD